MGLHRSARRDLPVPEQGRRHLPHLRRPGHPVRHESHARGPACLSKAPVPSGATGDPATALGTALGGASTFGPGADGGGLVDTNDPDDVVFAPCTFADGSFIEEWGIAYYAEGTIRGTDLTKLFRFDESRVPAVFSR